MFRYREAIIEAQQPGPCGNEPWAYFITFACYGHRLHGDERGSVDREHNSFGAPFVEASPLLQTCQTKRMTANAVTLDRRACRIALGAIQEVCRHENWTLYAVHVRTTHVHVVVRAVSTPERVMGKLKSYASRALNRRFGGCSKRWSRHGSTRRLWSPTELDVAVDYVLHRQGTPVAVYENGDRWSSLH